MMGMLLPSTAVPVSFSLADSSSAPSRLDCTSGPAWRTT